MNKYLIVGTGGTGGAIGGYLAADGKDVSFIARGRHLEAVREKGLTVKTSRKGEIHIAHPKVYDMESWQGKADVIFVCVKWYSIDDAIEFLKKAADAHTIVIPILNIIGAGEKMAEKLPGLTILDGVIYIASYVSAPAEITELGVYFDIICGFREEGHDLTRLKEIAEDLKGSKIDMRISHDIKSDAFEKFSMVSPFAAAGSYLDVEAKAFQQDPEKLKLFEQLVKEVKALVKGMGIAMRDDILEKNVDILMHCEPDSTASMEKDIRAGKVSELDGLVFEVVRLGKKYGVDVPGYAMIAKHFGFEG